MNDKLDASELARRLAKKGWEKKHKTGFSDPEVARQAALKSWAARRAKAEAATSEDDHEARDKR